MAGIQKALMRGSNTVINGLYRASGGRVMGRVRGMPVLLLTVAGRKSGTPHTTAVAYLEDDGRYVVAGSAGGAPSEPQWFRNLRHADHATVEVGRRRLDVTVAVAEAEERRVLWDRLVSRAPFFATYQDKVERQIPMAVLTPTS
jgi:deazaflavin-dependent oxidoreductase (nitroreductase family)